MPLSNIPYDPKSPAKDVLAVHTQAINDIIDAVNKLAMYNRIIIGEDVRNVTPGAGTTNYFVGQHGITRRTDIGEPVADGDQQLKQDDGKAGSD